MLVTSKLLSSLSPKTKTTCFTGVLNMKTNKSMAVIIIKIKRQQFLCSQGNYRNLINSGLFRLLISWVEGGGECNFCLKRFSKIILGTAITN